MVDAIGRYYFLGGGLSGGPAGGVGCGLAGGVDRGFGVGCGQGRGGFAPEGGPDRLLLIASPQ